MIHTDMHQNDTVSTFDTGRRVWALLAAIALAGLVAARHGYSLPEEKPELSGGEHRIDLSTAGVAEFTLLPGIGPVLANRIVEFRKERGGLRDSMDLTAVRGIGARTVERIAPYVRVADRHSDRGNGRRREDQRVRSD